MTLPFTRLLSSLNDTAPAQNYTQLLNLIAVRLSLVAVLAGSLSLALFWSAMVPLFQAPDEPTHFQYAHALATAKHVFRGRDGLPGSDPQIEALQRAMNTGGMAWRGEEAPDAYGTPHFFATVDASVAPLPDGFFDQPGNPIPNLVYTYPIGAYAVIGACIAALQQFHVGIVEQAFGARTFCGLLFTFGLLFWYLSFRALPLSVPRALGLTAIIGVFPLSSFVASYVQADNVTFALVSPILYCSLRVRDGDLRVPTITTYGLLFGLLLITKFHYALCAAVATVPILFIALNSARLARRRWLIRQALIVLPSVIALGLHLYISGGARQGYFSGPAALGTGMSGAFAQGTGDGLRYILAMANMAYHDYFILGWTMMSYWARFGWANVDVTFGNALVTNVVWALIVAWTNLTVLLTVFLIGNNLVRLRRIAVRRSPRGALTLLLRNPAFNIYVAFAFLMFVIYVTSGNSFAAQGRNWYPVEAAAFATMLLYAPRVLPRRWLGPTVAVAGSILIIGYVTVGSYYCIRSVESRYYEPMYQTTIFESDRTAEDPKSSAAASPSPALRIAGR